MNPYIEILNTAENDFNNINVIPEFSDDDSDCMSDEETEVQYAVFLTKDGYKIRADCEEGCKVFMRRKDVIKILYMPKSVLFLFIEGSGILRLENLYETELIYINARDCKISSIEKNDLPTSLISLNISGNLITNNSTLIFPHNLIALNISNNNLTKVPLLEDGILNLNISDNNIKKIYNLPWTIEHLVAYNCGIVIIENLPSHLLILDLANNCIEVVPELPICIEEIIIDGINIPLELFRRLKHLHFLCINGKELEYEDINN